MWHWWLWSPWIWSALQLDLGDLRTASSSLSCRCLHVQFLGFSEVEWYHSLVVPFVSAWKWWTQFITSQYVLQESLTFSFISSQKFLTGVYTSFLQFKNQMYRNPPCRHFVELKHVMDDMVCWTMTCPTWQSLCPLLTRQFSLITCPTSKTACSNVTVGMAELRSMSHKIHYS
jgi:hypothetical protein